MLCLGGRGHLSCVGNFAPEARRRALRRVRGGRPRARAAAPLRPPRARRRRLRGDEPGAREVGHGAARPDRVRPRARAARAALRGDAQAHREPLRRTARTSICPPRSRDELRAHPDRLQPPPRRRLRGGLEHLVRRAPARDPRDPRLRLGAALRDRPARGRRRGPRVDAHRALRGRGRLRAARRRDDPHEPRLRAGLHRAQADRHEGPAAAAVVGRGPLRLVERPLARRPHPRRRRDPPDGGCVDSTRTDDAVSRGRGHGRGGRLHSRGHRRQPDVGSAVGLVRDALPARAPRPRRLRAYAGRVARRSRTRATCSTCSTSSPSTRPR